MQPHCFNLFNVWTGGGTEKWTLKVFGSGHVEVRLNGVLQLANATDALGAVGWGASPNLAVHHTIWELTFRAAAGGFGVQLKDPGPRYSCEVLETEPVAVVGNATPGGGSSVGGRERERELERGG